MISNRYSPEYLVEDISAPLLATSVSFLVLETMFMGLMFASRYLAKGDRADKSMEVFMTTGYIVCIGKITIAILLVKRGGAGRHLVALPAATVQTALKLSMALQIVCPLTTSLSKLAVLCFLHRIFAHLGRWYRTVIYVTFSLVLAIMIAQVIIPFANCRPFSRTWNHQGPGSCAIAGLSLWKYLGIPNAFTTLIIVAIPVPALAKLHVSRFTKLGLAVVFLVCVVGIIAAIMRFQSFLEVTDFHDITYQNVKPLCWTIAESGIYFVAGVMPTLKPFFKTVFGGTALERLLTKGLSGAGSSNSRTFGRKWHQKELQPVIAAVTKQQPSLDVIMKDVALRGQNMPRVYEADAGRV